MTKTPGTTSDNGKHLVKSLQFQMQLQNSFGLIANSYWFFLKRLFLDEALQECGVDQIYEDCKFCTLNIHFSLFFCSLSFDIIPIQFQNLAATFRWNPAHFHPNWAGLAVLFSRQLLNGSQDLFFVSIF